MIRNAPEHHLYAFLIVVAARLILAVPFLDQEDLFVNNLVLHFYGAVLTFAAGGIIYYKTGENYSWSKIPSFAASAALSAFVILTAIYLLRAQTFQFDSNLAKVTLFVGIIADYFLSKLFCLSAAGVNQAKKFNS